LAQRHVERQRRCDNGERSTPDIQQLREALMARHDSNGQLAIAIVFILAATTGNTQIALGTSYTFLTQSAGTTFVDWHTASLWSPNGIPNAAGDEVILNRPTVVPSTAFTVNVNQNTTVGSITVNNTGHTTNNNLILDKFFGTLTFQSTSGPALLTENTGPNTGGRLDIQPDITLLSD
jgi:hypothetical protein